MSSRIVSAMNSKPSNGVAGSAVASALPENRLLRLPVYYEQSANELADTIRTAAQAGFSGLTVPLALGGLPIFPNRAAASYKLPKAPRQFRKRDVLGEIIRVARECRIGLLGVAPFWRLGGESASGGAAKWFRKHRHWFASDGPPDELAFCPCNAERRRYLGDLLAECLEGYPLMGIILDTDDPPFGAGPGNSWCQCESCREAALEQADLDLAQLAAGNCAADLVERWVQWQSEVAYDTLAYITRRSQKSRKGSLVWCRASVRNELSPGAGLAKLLWLDWMKKGVCDGLELVGLPAGQGKFAEAMAQSLKFWPDDAFLYPSIEGVEIGAISGVMEAIRGIPAGGCVIELAGPLTAVAAERLAGSEFAPGHYSAESDPMKGLEKIFREIAGLAPEGLGVDDFLTDLLRFADKSHGRGSIEAFDSVIENIRGLQARIRKGQIDFGNASSLALCRLGQAKRFARLASFQGPARVDFD
jgi:hypothetical protein